MVKLAGWRRDDPFSLCLWNCAGGGRGINSQRRIGFLDKMSTLPENSSFSWKWDGVKMQSWLASQTSWAHYQPKGKLQSGLCVRVYVCVCVCVCVESIDSADWAGGLLSITSFWIKHIYSFTHTDTHTQNKLITLDVYNKLITLDIYLHSYIPISIWHHTLE